MVHFGTLVHLRNPIFSIFSVISSGKKKNNENYPHFPVQQIFFWKKKLLLLIIWIWFFWQIFFVESEFFQIPPLFSFDFFFERVGGKIKEKNEKLKKNTPIFQD